MAEWCYREIYRFDAGHSMPVVRHQGHELSMDVPAHTRLLSAPPTRTLALPETALKGSWGLRYIWRLGEHTTFVLKRNARTHEIKLIFFKEGCVPVRPHRVVIDPGHGGKDPGSSASAVLEKEVTLQYARALRAYLRTLGDYDVHVTRLSDRFVSLADRVGMAERLGADVLVSLHADAFDDASIQGASVYALSPDGASNQFAKYLARSDEGTDGIKDSLARQKSLLGMVFDIQQSRSIHKSLRLAHMIQQSFERRSIPVHGRKVNQAGFVVLSSARVPSVLVELGYLSNPNDLARIRSKAGREAMVAALGTAIHDYCVSQKKEDRRIVDAAD